MRGTRRLAELLPEIVQAVKMPVLAAGGLAAGSDLIAAMSIGADGMMVGTALLATTNSFAHDYHRQRITGADGSDTTLTDVYRFNWPPSAPVRVLKSELTSTAQRSSWG